MTTIRLNKLGGQWQHINYAMSLSNTRIYRLCNSANKAAAISVGFWDRACDLFRPEKKAHVLAAVWDFIHSADNNGSGNEETLLPEKARKAFLRLKDLSDKPGVFVAELEITKREYGQYVLQAVFRINNEMVGNTPHYFTDEMEMKSWISNNPFIKAEKCYDNNELTKQILESAVRNGIGLRNIHLENVNLRGANLQGANLQRARLQSADLREAKLQKARLRGAHLQGTRLQGANLQGADLRGASLGGPLLQGTRLGRARMKGSTYNGEPLTRENISRFLTDAINTDMIDWS
ncbi:hypothetical protein F9222_24065 [Escherichia coli]|nr:hypothetical protein F9222_24065 [Escherichia coli]